MKASGVLSFAKNMCRVVSKNISENVSVKYNQKLHTKRSATKALKTTSKRAI